MSSKFSLGNKFSSSIDKAIPLAWRQQTARLLNLPLFIILGIAIFLCAIVGPFGTFGKLPFLWRFFYWGETLLAAQFFWCAIAICLAGTPLDPLTHRFFPLLLTAFGSAVAISLWVWLNFAFFWNWPANTEVVIVIFTTSLFINLAVTFTVSYFVQLFFSNGTTQPTQKESARDNHTENPLVTRIKREIGDDLIWLTMRDHYLEIKTSLGNDLILYRLSDAIQNLKQYNGLQIHRSHWVACNHITRLNKTGGKWQVEMSDGMILPISRSYRKELLALLERENSDS